ncbi:DUF2971 domain-containing protein [Aquimarina sp. AD10]|uniref:DUF2971 domain-containing protein n=1 Tax=Aquimarina sp. AD10 TaxID=1714849 RepID=UPI000E51CED0|nr:DUF2971 domain-containing protein [Aquimarina sp. AD10]AXT59571.1 DUF2971 domain-containing protein [Aquimarina sp. AD10]RKM92409.1 DUF2971 domain-containing protein [Aquimarina sp. AD10]
MFGSRKRKGDVKPNLVYKYRGGEFSRDLESLEKNYFWASSIAELNDPCEGINNWDKFRIQSNLIGNFIGTEPKEKLSRFNKSVEKLISTCSKAGIYSVSTTYEDELLWAHYSNAHKGFCIEYDLDILLESYQSNRVFSFPITYNSEPPNLSFIEVGVERNKLIQKILGFKSNRWVYENEYRIVTDLWGKYSYDFRAVRSIYFGLRMGEEQKENIMNILKGRGVKYFQMKLHPESYNFFREEVLDPNGSRLSYLKYIPEFIIGKKQVGFKIREKDYLRLKKRGNIKIEIESVISHEELINFATFIKDNLFQEAERINMFYDVKDKEDIGIVWATSHFNEGEIKVHINESI